MSNILQDIVSGLAKHNSIGKTPSTAKTGCCSLFCTHLPSGSTITRNELFIKNVEMSLTQFQFHVPVYKVFEKVIQYIRACLADKGTQSSL